MFRSADRVKETSIGTGTGALTLAGAMFGYRTFSSVLAQGDTCYYVIQHATLNEWEVGVGSFSSGSLSRTTVLSSSNSNSLVNFSAGTKEVFITASAEKFLQMDPALGHYGNFVAGTITASLAGTATQASQLVTPRTINGTNFNGSANITTANWGTSRNVTIGSSTKAVDGSGNVSWSLVDIGAQSVDADLDAIAALAGTSGLLRKTATNTWQLDTAAYVTSSGVTAVSGTAPIVSSGGVTPAISITAATTGAAGAMSAADKTKLDGIATSANNYQLPAAQQTALGGVELFSDTVQSVAANAVTTTASRTYGTQVNAAGQLVVNVPWADTDTVYTHPTGDGNLHVPATGTTNSGRVLTAGATAGQLSWTIPTTGTVTSVGGTGTVSGLTLTGTVTSTGNLTLGGTLAVTPSNFAQQTANTFLSAPNGAAGVPTFRTIVAADIPTLNQNTTGSAATLTTSRSLWGQSFNGSADLTGSINVFGIARLGLQSSSINGTVLLEDRYTTGQSLVTLSTVRSTGATMLGNAVMHVENATGMVSSLDMAMPRTAILLDLGAIKFQNAATSAVARGSAVTLSTVAVITAAGDLGVGVDTPLSRMHVNSPAQITSFTGTSRLGLTVTGGVGTSDLAGIDFTAGLNNAAARIAAVRGTSGSSLLFGTSNNYSSGITNTAMTLDASGNLLVNRTSSSGLGKLNVAGGADFVTGDVYIGRDSGRLQIASINAAGAAKLVVGQGNTTPINAVCAVNTANSAEAGLLISNWTGSATTNGPYIGFDNSTFGAWSIGSGNAVNSFDICQTWGTPLLRVASTGNLTVTGTITGTSFNSITGLASGVPLINGTAAVGSSTLAARQDHVHPTDTTRAATNQTMYIGTTTLTINRAAAAQPLTGITSIDGSAARIQVPDTRSINDQPQGKVGYAVQMDFKENASVSSPPVTSSGLYSHVMTVAGWDTGGGSGGWPAQVSFGDGLAIRQATSATVWGPWRTILNSNNYNTYSPTLTGTGASGTWGISVTGNAATVTNGVYTTGDQTIGGVKTFSSAPVQNSGYIGFLYGGSSGAPDATIWAVSPSNPTWGIFYNEGTPDAIEFRAAGSTTAYIALDTGAANFNGAITQNGNQVLHATNYNTYAPTLTGTGASGSWGISVTGSAATLTTARTINGVSFNGSANIMVPSLYDAAYKRITNPGGAEYTTSTSIVTGAIAVTLPVGMVEQMVRMTIKVYEYTTNRQFEIHCGGYMYAVGNTWANNPFAYIIGNPQIDRRFTVRLGYDSVSGKAIVYIGELASTWQYPQIFVTDVQFGYSGYSVNWTTGWAIGFEATAFKAVTATIQNCQVGYATSTNVANATVLRDASGNFAANAITLGSIQSTGIIQVLNGGAAQGIKIGSLVVSGSYANNAPTNGIYSSGQIQSAVTTGTAPLIVASTTRVANLNAATAGVADAAPWSGITSKPTTLSGYGITDAFPLSTTQVADLAALTSNGIYRQETPDSGFNYTTTLNLTSADGRQQLTIARSGEGMKFRGNATGTGTAGWSAWKTVVDSSNYTSYSPTLTGTGASGTWGISVTGNSANVTGTVAIANGGTGATTAPLARTALGATTVGSNLFTLTNPTAVTFLRVNADNTVSTLDAATFRTAIGAGTSSTVGTVTSVGGTGTVSGLTLTGTVTSTGNLTLGGTLSVAAQNFASQTANTFLAAPTGIAGVPTFRTLVAADVPTLNQNTTGTSANVTGTVAVANGGTGATTLTGVIKGNGTGAFTAAIANTDFLAATNPSYTGTLTGGTGIVNIGSGQFYKDASGNVGIGTASPSHALHVKGSSGAGSGTLSLSGGAEATGGASYIIMGNNDSGGATGPNVISSGNRTLQLGWGTSFTAAGGGTFTAGLTMNATQITANQGLVYTGAIQARVKYSVWENTAYGIGMGAGYTFGGLENDYALTSQMINNDNRGFWWGDDAHTNAQGAMALTTTGLLTLARGARIGFGESDTTVPTTGVVEINGLLTATQKSFTIPHPTREGFKLRYGSLEGPENGVYIRGKLNGYVINLPEYWTKLVDPDSITVQLTPIGKHQKLYVEDIRDNKVYVANDSMFSNEVNCYYYILAERVDVNKLEVEINVSGV